MRTAPRYRGAAPETREGLDYRVIVPMLFIIPIM